MEHQRHQDDEHPPSPPLHTSDSSNTSSFEDGVAQILLRIEEHRQQVHLRVSAQVADADDAAHDPPAVEDWQYELEDLVLNQLPRLHRYILDRPEEEHTNDFARRDLFLHVRQKVLEGMQNTLQSIVTLGKLVENQGAVARLFELTLLLVWDSNHNGEEGSRTKSSMVVSPSAASQHHKSSVGSKMMQDIVDQYAAYQRSILRQRAKQAIAHLAHWRKAQQQRSSMKSTLTAVHEDSDDPDTTANSSAPSQPHSHAMTVILGQASALAHPLQVWMQGLPSSVENGNDSMVTWLRRMCEGAIQVLDEQAQSLTKTISDWFWEDRAIPGWMTKSSSTSLTVATASGSSVQAIADLAQLDAVIEEMAFGCQLLARYQTLMQNSRQTIVADQLLPDWTWTYAALERFLVTQQWQSALDLACPVHIVIGKSLQVPSVVEDAQYLSTRALERATSTRSVQAMGTVAHSLSHDVWSTDDTFQSGVHQALVEQRGCWAVPDETIETKSTNDSPPRSGNRDSFASALLDALDDDLGGANGGGSSKSNPTSPPSSAPTSTGFLGSLATLGGGSAGQDDKLQTGLEMQLCALNGIQSASVACDSLVQSLDTMLQDESIFNSAGDRRSTSMIELAREELLRYAGAYRSLLSDQVSEILSEWCGTAEMQRSSTKTRGGYTLCLDALREFFRHEDYNLTSHNFSVAEADERLERDMMGCLQQARILRNLDRCDAEVSVAMSRELSCRLAAVILNALWDGSKRMSDWGSLLLSKQVRLLQNHVSDFVANSEVNTAVSFLEQWERVSQVVTVLQLEKPSDWLAYQATNVALTKEELRQTFHLRVDFSSEAIAAVCGGDTRNGPSHGSDVP